MADGDTTAEERDDPAGFERAGAILSELAEATRSAAEALLDEQKRHAATRVRGLAEAVRCAAESLDQSEISGIGRHADRAAGQIEQLAQSIGEQNWAEIVADTRDFARRRPWLFLCVATAAGFVAGRVLSAPSARGRQETIPPVPQTFPDGSETGEVIMAVSSGDGRLAGQRSGQERH
jgi:hypothetical protein